MLSAHPELYHTFLECGEECLAQLLDNAVDARELTEGEEKVLLWNAFGGLLPQALLHRKKSPYPKTYSPCLRQALSFWHTWYR